MPPALPQAATAPPGLVMAMTLASTFEPTASIAARPALLVEHLRRVGELLAVDDLVGAEAVQVVALLAARPVTAITW